MNRDLISYPEFTITRYISGRVDAGSLNYKLECQMAKSDVVVSYSTNSKKNDRMDANFLAQVYAVIYIPFGERGEKYLAEKLAEVGETIESNNKKRIYHIGRNDHFSQADIDLVDIGSKPLSKIDLNESIEPNYLNVPGFVFKLYSILDEINRAGLYPKEEFSSFDDVFNKIKKKFDTTGKLEIPEKIKEIMNSSEFKKFEESGLTNYEKAYIDDYFEKTDFISVGLVGKDSEDLVTKKNQ